jgi:hypothetical protein
MQPEIALENTKKLLDAQDLEQAWFDAPPPSSVGRISVAPPAPVEKVGEFLGDPDVDGWLR